MATRVKYTLTEYNEIINDDRKMSSIFNDFFFFFLNIVSNLNIHQSEDLLVYLENFNDPIEKLREEHKKSF